MELSTALETMAYVDNFEIKRKANLEGRKRASEEKRQKQKMARYKIIWGWREEGREKFDAIENNVTKLKKKLSPYENKKKAMAQLLFCNADVEISRQTNIHVRFRTHASSLIEHIKPSLNWAKHRSESQKESSIKRQFYFYDRHSRCHYHQKTFNIEANSKRWRITAARPCGNVERSP